MRSPARRRSSDTLEDVHARLSARIAVLEDRVRRLEARLRVSATSQTPAVRTSAVRTSPRRADEPSRAPAARARPRCPGCTLELPRGRRGESCVWCGFEFSAVSRRRPARKKR
ncbi:hypothetical protein [Pyxidicoccus xibeiensis]|uniref:hypothetical protein n=1 Tax=Pyxidicoccus xibeiensis TaxID=2906759 RepID=UPI0020A74B58|nr:hypothetical protein [Pyxidicoccus xibeiensis]MCP3142164.1 hypothetical protein [Pyxidicoccus xibeiensis]